MIRLLDWLVSSRTGEVIRLLIPLSSFPSLRLLSCTVSASRPRTVTTKRSSPALPRLPIVSCGTPGRSRRVRPVLRPPRSSTSSQLHYSIVSVSTIRILRRSPRRRNTKNALGKSSPRASPWNRSLPPASISRSTTSPSWIMMSRRPIALPGAL